MPQFLRPYQNSAVSSVLDAIDPFNEDGGLHRVLFTQPTGVGKTTVMAELTRQFLENGDRVLLIAHRKELLQQAYKRIRDQCNLSEFDMGIEQAELRCEGHEKVIIGSVQSVYRENRLNGWKPTVIFCDEAHRAAAPTYRKIFEKYGVYDGECSLIGTTATAKRTDRQSLYAQYADGSPVMLARKGGTPKPANPEETVFERHIYEYDILSAIEDGWLVPIRGCVVETSTDINDVKTVAGDFVEAQLAKAIDNAERTAAVIEKWKEVAGDRPTLVFCASVEHAHHAAEMWTEAGYKAAALDGETDSFTRSRIYDDFHEGRLQVLTNMGLFTEGADVPRCSCIVHLRPTKSWNLYVQMSGRSSRVLPGVLDGMEETLPEFRQQAIAASLKPDALIIDAVDVYKKCGELCTVPSILDLPVKLNLEGHSVMEAKRLLDEHAELKERIIGECPKDFTALKAIIYDVDMVRKSGAKSQKSWDTYADGSGYVCKTMPPKFSCQLLKQNGSYRLLVTGPADFKTIDKIGKPDRDMKEYLEAARKRADAAIAEYKASHAGDSRGTLGRLPHALLNTLRNAKRNDAEIDAMPFAKAAAIARKILAQPGVMPLGKYAGLPLEDVPTDYIRWCIDNWEPSKRPDAYALVQNELTIRKQARL